MKAAMIPQSDLSLHDLSWQQQLKNSFRDVQSLSEALNLEVNDLSQVLHTPLNFPVKVPQSFVARMEPGNINDPLLRQVLPLIQESLLTPGFTHNPVGDHETNLMPGLIHKYQGRVLLMVSTHCAINCRYCFRREFPYQDNRPTPQQWQQVINYIAQDSSISEVIYSGGDPLTLADKKLAKLTHQIAEIPHIKRLRIHTRLPVVIPARITDKLLDWLTGTRLTPVMVLHINHPNEINQHLNNACKDLCNAGVTLLNQSVLLKGVNDCTETLTELSQQLFNAGVLPYYLHLLDRVSGAAHFDVSSELALILHKGLQSRLPGYLVPKLVREVAGLAFKQPVL